MQLLPTTYRSVIDENQRAVQRRWKISQDRDWMKDEQFDTLFPDQRCFFRLLSQISEAKAAAIADCPAPLFQVQIEADIKACTNKIAQEAPLRRCSATLTEVFLAILSRLDALRVDQAIADVVFGMPAHQRILISSSTPAELHSVAHDPKVLLKPLVRDEYFQHAISCRYTTSHRLMLSLSTRRANPNLGRLRNLAPFP